jgi:SAM-dependent methyltransferase
MSDLTRFASLTFADFRRMALDGSLPPNERIGFPDSYRAGKDQAIFDDIITKLPALRDTGKTVADIGCGCSTLPRLLIELCERRGNHLVLIDSEEMLSQLPDSPAAAKRAGSFPLDQGVDELTGNVDAVLVYSVLHYVFAEGNVWGFIDRALELLAPGGRLLVGDVPNISKRKRFFGSDAGRRFHREFMHTQDDPEVMFNVLEPGAIDDAVVLAIMSRARLAGFDAYVVPQDDELPMSNRREDIIIARL